LKHRRSESPLADRRKARPVKQRLGDSR